MNRSKFMLKCFCSRRPLLAMYGVDERGRLYVHIKVYKQRRVFAELIAREGQVEINCRECLRWHTVTFRKNETAELKEIDRPVEVGFEEEKNDSAGAS